MTTAADQYDYIPLDIEGSDPEPPERIEIPAGPTPLPTPPKKVEDVIAPVAPPQPTTGTQTETKPALVQQDTTREKWLHRAADMLIKTLFEPNNATPHYFRVSCGWTGHGARSKRIGECWYPQASGDGHCELFISPILDNPLDPQGVLEVLTHEMCHAAAFVKGHTGHGHPFKRIATAVGLDVKTNGAGSTLATPALLGTFQKVVDTLGAYPHAALTATTTKKKKQSTRMVKCACECGIVYRTTKTHLEKVANAPCCIDPDCLGTVTVG